MRNVIEVIDQMLAVIPPEHDELRVQLEWAQRDASYKAPEQMRAQWQMVGELLEALIGEPTLEWEKNVASIFNDVEAH